MSTRCTIRLYDLPCGLDVHVWHSCFDDSCRKVIDLGLRPRDADGRRFVWRFFTKFSHEFQVWPPKFVYDPHTHWTSGRKV